tara:strand:- start:231 stop:410 length:180 start_codon:yes stop_codon:yes gene_type:complete
MQLAWAGFGIAAAPLGALAEIIGLRVTIVAMGIVTFCVVSLYGSTLKVAGKVSAQESGP